MPGRPLAVGGPSKNTNAGAVTLPASVCSKRRSRSHCASTSFSSASAGRSGGSGSNCADGIALASVAVIALQPLQYTRDDLREPRLRVVRDADDLLDRCRLEAVR